MSHPPETEKALSAPNLQADFGVLFLSLSFSGDSVVKNLLAMQETWVQSLGQEDPL